LQVVDEVCDEGDKNEEDEDDEEDDDVALHGCEGVSVFVVGVVVWWWCGGGVVVVWWWCGGEVDVGGVATNWFGCVYSAGALVNRPM
jgi:hypothetical protein